MSAQTRLLAAYEDLQRLAKEAVAALEQGADLETLAPIFEQKAALASQLGQISPQEALQEAEGRDRLLEAQRNAALAEAELVKALQPFVSSNENRARIDGRKGDDRPGQRWDFLG